MFDPPAPYDSSEVAYDEIVVDFDGSLLLLQTAVRGIRHPRDLEHTP